MDGLISVIVPVYKVEKYLNKCVESILAQTYKNLEIILVDDGSPDGCPAICDEWAKRDTRIHVIHKINGGLSDARNAGLQLATGQYVAFVDSDDWLEPNMYERLYEVLTDTSADIVECGVLFEDDDGNILRDRKCERPIHIYTAREALRQLVLEDGVYQTVWNKIYRRTVLDGIDFPVGKCNEDEFWTYRVIDCASSYAVIEDTLYHYLQRDSSIMGQVYSIKRLDGLEARYDRFLYLRKYTELQNVCIVYFYKECMYHLQMALKSLLGEDRKNAVGKIKTMIKKSPQINFYKTNISGKYRMWFALFRLCPCGTAKLRNCLKIGF